MALARIQHDNVYVARLFQATTTTVEIDIDERKNYIRRVNGLITDQDSETVLVEQSFDNITDECRMPTESELRQARLMNIPTRGFCVSADLEKITADSYRYLYDPEEFETPDI